MTGNDGKLVFLPRRPRLQHVFPAQLALVADQRELECVVRPFELVDAGAFAAFRFRSTGAVERDLIALHRVGSPSIPSSMMLQINIECAVGLDRPNRAEGICPSPDQRGLSGLFEHGASPKQRDGRDSENN